LEVLLVTKKELKAITNKWHKRLGVQENEIHYKFQNELEGSGSNRNSGAANSSAMTTSWPEYRYFEIDISNSWLKRANIKEVEATICHELVHVLTSQTYDLAHSIIRELPKTKQDIYTDWFRRENEEVTTSITNVLIGAQW
jgi:predicted metal-dependent hydrolase